MTKPKLAPPATTVGSLSPDPRNPRFISDERLAMLRASLARFGDLSGIVYNRRSRTLVGAHQRGRVLPADSPIEITRRYDPPTERGTVAEGYVTVADERFSYREVDWDEPTATAAMVAANRHSGDWDHVALAGLVRELPERDQSVLGFTRPELDRLLEPPKQPTPPEKFPEYDGAVKTSYQCPACQFKW